MNLKSIEYWNSENLNLHLDEYRRTDPQAKTADNYEKTTNPIPADIVDLVRLHKLIRDRKCFTVLEFGVGFSTVVIADALAKNKADWETLEDQPAIRNRFMFKCFTVDTSQKWIDASKSRLPDNLKHHISFHLSDVEVGTHNGQMCHFYKKLPDMVPDFIYLDGPDPKAVKGSINGMTFQCNERTVMSGDLLLMEPILIPGTMILIDGRTNNARFLKNNLKRDYDFRWDKAGDVTTIELVEERLGKYNILGSDYF